MFILTEQILLDLFGGIRCKWITELKVEGITRILEKKHVAVGKRNQNNSYSSNITIT